MKCQRIFILSCLVQEQSMLTCEDLCSDNGTGS